jgi:lycopene cyclase domain-containing protein
MNYSEIAILALGLVLLLDIFILKTRLVSRKSFWTSYAIMLFFQLITNGWLTSREIVTYNSSKIIGLRIAAAPIEDLLFGFSLILAVLSFWIYWGRRGLQIR